MLCMIKYHLSLQQGTMITQASGKIIVHTTTMLVHLLTELVILNILKDFVFIRKQTKMLHNLSNCRD